MIPKIIHYCWFGRKPKPEIVKKYIENWSEMNPDFIIKEWNEDNFNLDIIPFVRQAYNVRKYAFVADVARLYALITDGGIYLDTDVELRKPFTDDLLCNISFLGFEQSRQFMIGTAVIGSVPQNRFWINFLEMYKQKEFILGNGKYNTIPNVDYLTELLVDKGLNLSDNKQYVEGICIYPHDYFSPKNYSTKRIVITENTIAIHHFSGTWQPKWKRVLLLLWVPLTAKYPKITKRIRALIQIEN